MARERKGQAGASTSTTKKRKAPSSRTPSKKATPSEFTGKEALTSEELTRFKKLEQRKVLTTKFFDVETLKDLGFYDIMDKLMTKGGVRPLLEKCCPTYKVYTYEFLATLEKRMDENGELTRITFKLGGKERELDLDDLRSALRIGLPPEEKFSLLTESQWKTFWEAITGKEKKAGHLSNLITHPYLRLLHRFISMTFLGHGEPTKINMSELSYLWVMIPEAKGIPDWATLFVDTCLTNRKAVAGKISQGGMITLLCKHFNIKRSAFSEVVWDYSFTLDGLHGASMFRIKSRRQPRGIWLYSSDRISYLRLPRPVGDPLPFGPKASDFYIPRDGSIPATMSGSENEGDEDVAMLERDARLASEDREAGDQRTESVREPTHFEGGGWSGFSSWCTTADGWTDSVDASLVQLGTQMRRLEDRLESHDDTMEEIGNHLLESLAYQRSLHEFYLKRYPSEISPLSKEMLDGIQEREAARVARRAARANATRDRAGPSSSH